MISVTTRDEFTLDPEELTVQFRQRMHPKRLLAALAAVVIGATGLVAVASRAEAAVGFTVAPRSDYSDIKAMQYLLNAHGIATAADGSFGPATTRSVRTFQARRGLAVNGTANSATMAAMTRTAARYGSTNRSQVRAVQTLLIKLGHPINADGSFGPATRAAVRAEQSRGRLAVDGVVGPNTWSYLFRAHLTIGQCSARTTRGIPVTRTGIARHGIRVAACAVSGVNRMVDRAAAAGVGLYANSGWRSYSHQVRLRRQNCGTSYYAIYLKPASQCHPNTARPGTSIHEFGLAIDMSNSGWGSRVYRWMTAYGPSFGYRRTVPSEPWHWSPK